MDLAGIAAGTQHLRQPGPLKTAAEIEEYTEYLCQFLKQLVELTVPLAKAAPGFSYAWWSPEVDNAVRRARAARRQGAPAEVLHESYRHKKRTIQRAKTAHFRQEVHRAATRGGGIWGLVRWAKERSNLPPEPPIIPGSESTTM